MKTCMPAKSFFALHFPAMCMEHELLLLAKLFVPGTVKGGSTMAENKTSPSWHELCKEASEERDPRKLLELLQEINEALADQRTQRAEAIQ